jgi:hypothetical protein
VASSKIGRRAGEGTPDSACETVGNQGRASQSPPLIIPGFRQAIDRLHYFRGRAVRFSILAPHVFQIWVCSVPPLRVGEQIDDLVFLLDMAAVVTPHGGVAIAERGGNMVIIGARDALQFGREGRA